MRTRKTGSAASIPAALPVPAEIKPVYREVAGAGRSLPEKHIDQQKRNQDGCEHAPGMLLGTGEELRSQGSYQQLLHDAYR
jgi:hypothetical protein